jgi:hypothetical protein
MDQGEEPRLLALRAVARARSERAAHADRDDLAAGPPAICTVTQELAAYQTVRPRADHPCPNARLRTLGSGWWRLLLSLRSHSGCNGLVQCLCTVSIEHGENAINAADLEYPPHARRWRQDDKLSRAGQLLACVEKHLQCRRVEKIHCAQIDDKATRVQAALHLEHNANVVSVVKIDLPAKSHARPLFRPRDVLDGGTLQPCEIHIVYACSRILVCSLPDPHHVISSIRVC